MTTSTNLGLSVSTPLAVSNQTLSRHLAMVSNSQSLISDMALSFVNQQIEKGGGLILFDPSADQELTETIYGLMKAANRLDQFKLVSFDHPELSHTYNMFSSGGAEAALATTDKNVSLEDFWTNVNRVCLMAVVLTLKLQPGTPIFDIKDVMALLSDFDLLLSCTQKINPDESASHKAGAAYIADFLSRWRTTDGDDWSRKHYKALLIGLVSKLAGLSMSESGCVVNTYTPDVDLKQSILNNEVVVLSWPGMAQDAEMIGALFITDLTRAIGEILLENKAHGLFPVIFTQYPTFISEHQMMLFQLARAASVPLIIGVRGSSVYDSSASSHAESLLSNCWTRMYGEITDDTTLGFATRIESGVGGDDMLEALSALLPGLSLVKSSDGAPQIVLHPKVKRFTGVQLKDVELQRRANERLTGVNAWDQLHPQKPPHTDSGVEG